MGKNFDHDKANKTQKVKEQGSIPGKPRRLSGADRPTPIIPHEIQALKGVMRLNSQNKADLRRFFKRASFQEKLAAIKFVFDAETRREMEAIARAIDKAHVEGDTFIPWPMAEFVQKKKRC